MVGYASLTHPAKLAQRSLLRQLAAQIVMLKQGRATALGGVKVLT
jgi:hypothetical protein